MTPNISSQVHLQRGAPLLMMTATITHEEMEDVIKLSGRRKRSVVHDEGPDRSHHKLHMVRRPSSQVPLQGHMDAKQTFVPGLLQLLRHLCEEGAATGVCWELQFGPGARGRGVLQQLCQDG